MKSVCYVLHVKLCEIDSYQATKLNKLELCVALKRIITVILRNLPYFELQKQQTMGKRAISE